MTGHKNAKKKAVNRFFPHAPGGAGGGKGVHYVTVLYVSPRHIVHHVYLLGLARLQKCKTNKGILGKHNTGLEDDQGPMQSVGASIGYIINKEFIQRAAISS